MDAKSGKKMELSDVIGEVNNAFRTGVRDAVFTGGEPAIVGSKAWAQILDSVVNTAGKYPNCGIEIETSGIKIVEEWESHLTFINVSPKPNALDKMGAKYITNLSWYSSIGSVFKFVVGDKIDTEFVWKILSEIGVPANRVWIMPKGTTIKEMQKSWKFVEKIAKGYAFNVSDRLQIVLKIR
jgi:organic radical activating enzyme